MREFNNIKEELWFIAAVIYAKYYTFLKIHFRIDRQKLGFFLRNIKRPRIIKVDGLLFQANPEVITSFARMIGGAFNEEETHLFLHRIIDGIDNIDLFVDVGSNIGEFIVEVGSTKKVEHIVGFEPNPECVKSSQASIALNKLDHTEVIQKVLTDACKPVQFDLRGENAHLHSIFDTPARGSEVVVSSTIDHELKVRNKKAILLVDVEGAENLVLKGGREFIAGNLPLIIFEHNYRSRLYYSLDDLQRVLPEGYEILRIRYDGYLDRDLRNTANCVAVHERSPLFGIVAELMVAQTVRSRENRFG